ncbi:ABC transporter permease [Parachitinimonas caeni]|uniref:ABC transporter permease n=1 Tax=Parachitinimonas caeni TaxID=3031301 RepID=A0ABT7E3H9_9NEIS|nr:ABC transporter permease [Parachitinimonas caeni]MDK2126874.1 ABC transporter permease [Parachitinimonas caeni]
MNLQRITAYAYKEWREIARDRLFFSLAFVVPPLLMLLFGVGLSLDVEHIPFVVIDQDHSQYSRDYAARYSSGPYFNLLGQLDHPDRLDTLMASGTVRAALIIPAGFGARLAAGKPTEVQTLIDGTFPSRALTTKGYLDAINAQANLDGLAKLLAQRSGLTEDAARQRLTPVKLAVRYRYNEAVLSLWSIVPKLLMVILMISPPFLTSIGVVREKESGAIFNLYASNLSRGEYLLGKLAPYVAISFLNAWVLWLMALWVFGVPFRGSLAFFALASGVYVLCTTGIGLLVSIATRSQVAAMIVTAIVTVVPAVLYSGVLIPVPSLGPTGQLIAHALPAMYYTEIAVGCFLKGSGMADLWPQLLVLAGYAAALFTAGFLLMSKRPKV